MTSALMFALTGAVLAGMGAKGLILLPHLLRKMIALNIMGAGVFLVLVSLAARSDPPDPVPHAMVLTGLVVSISATGMALALIRRYHGATGKVTLDDSDDCPPPEAP